MYIERMADPRAGQKVQCCKCKGMVDAAEAMVDRDGKAGDIYHARCVPRGVPLPPLTKSEVRTANKVYKHPVDWEAYIDIATAGKENEGVERKVIPVKAVSRDQAFDKLRGEVVRYQMQHPTRVVVTQAVPHKPRLTR